MKVNSYHPMAPSGCGERLRELRVWGRAKGAPLPPMSGLIWDASATEFKTPRLISFHDLWQEALYIPARTPPTDLQPCPAFNSSDRQEAGTGQRRIRSRRFPQILFHTTSPLASMRTTQHVIYVVEIKAV